MCIEPIRIIVIWQAVRRAVCASAQTECLASAKREYTPRLGRDIRTLIKLINVVYLHLKILLKVIGFQSFPVLKQRSSIMTCSLSLNHWQM